MDIPGVSRISGSNPERLLTAGTAAEPMLGRGGILLCPRGFPAVTVRLKLRDGAAKSPCTCGLDSEIYSPAIVKPDEVFDYYEIDAADLPEDTEA